MSKFVLTTIVVASALLNEASAVVVKAPVRRRVVDAAVLAEVIKELPKVPSVNLLALPASERVPTHEEVFRQMSMLEAMDKFTKLANKSLLAQVGKIQKSGLITERSVVNKVTLESDSKSHLRGVHKHSNDAEVADKQSPATQAAYIALHGTIEKINELMEQTVTGDEVDGDRCAEEEQKGKERCGEASTALTVAQAKATGLQGQIQEMTLSARLHQEEVDNAEAQKTAENITFTDIKAQLDQELATLPVDITVCETILEKISECQTDTDAAAGSFLQVVSENLQCKQCEGGQQVAEIGGEWKAQLSKMSSASGKEALKDLLGESKSGILLGVRQVVKRQPDPVAVGGAPAGDVEQCPMDKEVILPEDRGMSYMGCQNRTIDGDACLPWTANYSAKVGPAGTELANHSYCRNPDPEGGKYTIWCFVSPEFNSLGWQTCLPVAPPHGFGEPSFNCNDKAGACKLSADSCSTLLEKFSETQALLQEALTESTDNHTALLEKHKTEVEEFDNIIDGSNNMLSAAQAMITELQAEMHTELATMQKETKLYNLARAEYMEHQGACCDRKKSRLSERCALEKVRTSVANEGNMSVYDCVLGEWQDQGGCFSVDEAGQPIPKTCLAGLLEKDLLVERNQIREVESQPLNGIICEHTEQKVKCELELCPVDCMVQPWGSWSMCTVACNGGSQLRERNVVVQKQGEGLDCPQPSERRSCNNEPCDVDCQLDPYFPDFDDSKCSKPCMLGNEGGYGDGPGHHESIRGIHTEKVGGGQECPDERLECTAENRNDCRLMARECNGEKVCARNETTGLVSCDSKLDVIVMLDSSGSLGTDGWKAEVSAVIPMLRAMGEDVAADVMIWSGPKYGKTTVTIAAEEQVKQKWKKACQEPVFEERNPKNCGVQWVEGNVTADKEGLVAKLEAARDNTYNWKDDKIGFMNSMTYSGKALQMAHQKLSSGMGRSGVDKVLVLVIDGTPTDKKKTKDEAEKIKALGVKLIVMAIGNAAKRKSTHNWLKQLVSHPQEDNLIMEGNFDELINPFTINKVLVRACPGIKIQMQYRIRNLYAKEPPGGFDMP